MSNETKLRVLITGGEGDLARALNTAFSGDDVLAPGRGELDVRDEQQLDAYFANLPRLDVLIANAGMTRDGSILNLGAGDFSDVIDTNLKGAFLCVRAAIRLMVKQRSGHILLIGSRSGKKGPRGQTA